MMRSIHGGDGFGVRRASPYVALAAALAGVFVAADDQTVIVTVLPRIMADLGTPITEIDRASWAISGYLLGYVAAMPLIGRLSDIYGHRNLFVGALAAFAAGSAGVALAPNLEWLIGLRVFQALGAGALVPISIAIAGDLFPRARRGLALGLVGAAAEAGGVIGPLWGGIVTRFLAWEWVFWLNLPLCAIVVAMAIALLPPSPRHRGRVDFVGGGLVAASLAALTLGAARIGEPDALTAGWAALAAAAFGLFVWRQARADEPLLPRAMFRARALVAANVAHLPVGAALIVGMVTVPLMANTVLGRTPLEGGLMLMRMTAALPVGAVLGGMLCQRVDCRAPAVAGLLIAALGFRMMSGWGLDVADPWMTLHLAVTGFGFGLLIAPIALAATNSAPEDARGAAAALVTAMRIIGMTLGVAALTAWGTGRFEGLIAGASAPFALPGETAAQTAERLSALEWQLTEAGLTLFSDFFVAGMWLCIAALAPVGFMAWGGRRRGAAGRRAGGAGDPTFGKK